MVIFCAVVMLVIFACCKVSSECSREEEKENGN